MIRKSRIMILGQGKFSETDIVVFQHDNTIFDFLPRDSFKKICKVLIDSLHSGIVHSDEDYAWHLFMGVG